MIAKHEMPSCKKYSRAPDQTRFYVDSDQSTGLLILFRNWNELEEIAFNKFTISCVRDLRRLYAASWPVYRW